MNNTATEQLKSLATIWEQIAENPVTITKSGSFSDYSDAQLTYYDCAQDLKALLGRIEQQKQVSFYNISKTNRPLRSFRLSRRIAEPSDELRIVRIKERTPGKQVFVPIYDPV